MSEYENKLQLMSTDMEEKCVVRFDNFSCPIQRLDSM